MLHRRTAGGDVEILLGHMGGPYWAHKDAGAWTIPKGEYDADDEPFDAALREFEEEIGVAVPSTEFVDLGEVRQSGGKIVRAWAARLTDGIEFDPTTAVSNTFEMEWPPKSGQVQTFPELDRVTWFDLGTARSNVVTAQRELLDRLLVHLGDPNAAQAYAE